MSLPSQFSRSLHGGGLLRSDYARAIQLLERRLLRIRGSLFQGRLISDPTVKAFFGRIYPELMGMWTSSLCLRELAVDRCRCRAVRGARDTGRRNGRQGDAEDVGPDARVRVGALT